ncbi:hypothetical protein cyc_02830 [Cyclospora cayetanensis]|uniref:Uncharacterized protein n=1 Tax=Cyclospora cayetanensis TaxID=88456 RepID=A0A1D3D1W4_9EIME|nr:hypothetical protein cyc_02830 [Cyclospora cayetanensis]
MVGAAAALQWQVPCGAEVGLRASCMRHSCFALFEKSLVLQAAASGKGCEVTDILPPSLLAALPAATAEAGALQWAEWLPDGSGVCSVFEGGLMRFYATPENLSSTSQEAEGDAAFAPTVGGEGSREGAPCTAGNMTPWLEVCEGEAIRAVAFSQELQWEYADRCCFAVAAVDHPIQLRRLRDGALLCSLMAVDRGDELRQEWLLGNRRSKGHATQKGIISAIAALSSSSKSTLVACGSHAGTVGLYDLRSKRNKTAAVDGQTLSGGVTQHRGVGVLCFALLWLQLMFAGGELLLSGHRQDPFIRCWDLRALETPLFRLKRRSACRPNKMLFDVKDEALVAGNQDGSLSVFSLRDGSQVLHLPDAGVVSSLGSSDCPTCLSAEVLHSLADGCRGSSVSGGAEDCPLVSTAFHPHLPILLTAHSRRTFHMLDATEKSALRLDSAVAMLAAPSAVLYNWAIGMWTAAAQLEPLDIAARAAALGADAEEEELEMP